MSTPDTMQDKPARPPAPAAGPRKIPAPRVLPESLPYWTAADEGRLLIKQCNACGEVHHYPRDICPHCLSADTEWLQTAGTGTVYSFSTMGKGEAAYTLAFVTLADDFHSGIEAQRQFLGIRAQLGEHERIAADIGRDIYDFGQLAVGELVLRLADHDLAVARFLHADAGPDLAVGEHRVGVQIHCQHLTAIG